jgi:hypothetical protein
MTQPAPIPVQAPWARADYQAAINAKIKEEFDDPAEPFDPVAELAKLPELQRLDFDQPWRVGEPHPGDASLIFMSFFAGELPGDVLAYVFPVSGDPASKLWRRYTLNRGGGVSTVEGMTRETFVEEIATEWATLLSPDEDDGEEEEEEVEQEEEPAAGTSATIVP